MLTAFILSLALVMAQDPSPPAPEAVADQIVSPGHAGVGLLAAGDGEEVRLTLKIDAPGAVTISLESFQFDPVVSVADGQDRVIARDEDSGTGDGAWLSLDVKPFVTYEIVIGSQDKQGGHYHLTVHDGRPEPPDETDNEGLVRLYSLFAEYERARGELGATAHLYYTIGSMMFGLAEYVIAAPPLREARALAGETNNSRMEVAATAYLGGCERRAWHLEEAVDLLEQAWEKRAVIGDPAFDCLILENLGKAQFDRHELDEALKHLDAWADVAAEAGLVAFEAMAHTRRGETLFDRGDREAAGAAHDLALALLDGFEDPYYESQVLLNAGQYFRRCDRYSEAAEVIERASHLTTSWDVQLAIQIAMGDVHTSRGRYGPARQCLERATALLGDRDDPRFEVFLQFNMANLAFRTGDHYGARELAELALEGARGKHDLRLQVQLLSFIGMLQEQTGELFAASRTYEQAQGLCGALDDPALEWRVLFDQGRLHHTQQRYAKALDLQSRALELVETLDEPGFKAACLNGIAYTRTFLGEHERAREDAQAALAIWVETERPGQVVVVLHTLAVVALAGGQLDEVDRLMARADEIIEHEDVSGLERMVAAGVRSGFVAWAEIAQDLVLSRLAEPDADRAALAAQGYDRAGRWKARALLEGMPTSSGPEDQLDTLRAALGTERVLIEYTRGAKNLYAYVLDADELRLVDLGTAPELDTQVDGFLAGITQLDSLAPADELAERGGALYDLMLAPVLATLDRQVDGLVIVPTPALARLPFEALVLGADASRGAALGFDEIEFLADRYHVTYGPSSPVLARLSALGPRRTPGRALVMGDPWYASEINSDPLAVSSSSTARDPRTTSANTYDRLLATKAEVMGIAEALLLSEPDQGEDVKTDLIKLIAMKRERSGELTSRRFDLYVGEHASADKLQRDLREYEVLHIAAHGEVDPRNPLRTGLILSYDGEVHGYLTLPDILELQLDANLVVLSACDTARGRILKGEGVQSMAQAFLQAGSRAVIASLWSVDDSATRVTMSQFYESILLGNRSGAEALRDAKTLRQLKQNVRHYGHARGPAPGEPLHKPATSNIGHPYYWAPFIYIGAIP